MTLQLLLELNICQWRLLLWLKKHIHTFSGPHEGNYHTLVLTAIQHHRLVPCRPCVEVSLPGVAQFDLACKLSDRASTCDPPSPDQ